MTDFRLVENKNFNNLPVNLTMSTVHVPTSLYDRCTYIQILLFWFMLTLYTVCFIYLFICSADLVDAFFEVHWARSSSAKRLAKRSGKKTYLAELLSTDLSQRWDKTFVLARSLYPQFTEMWAVQAEE